MRPSRPVPRSISLSLALLATVVLLCDPRGAAAQIAEPADVTGRWEGSMDAGLQGEITMVFHVSAAGDGSLTSRLDVPTQGAVGIPTDGTTVHGDTLSITIPAIQGRYVGVLGADGSMEGTWSQGGASLPLTLRRRGEATELVRPQHPTPPFPYRVEEVTYTNREAGITLAGSFTRPEGEGPFAAALLISGSGPQDRDELILGHRPFLVLADHLTRKGVAVLRVDDRGVGGSGGEFDGATSRDFASDVRAGVAWLEERDEVDAVGLIGHSEGGLIAPMVAAHDPRVDFIVLLAGPGVPGSELLPEQVTLLSAAAGMPDDLVEWNRRLVEDAVAAVLRVDQDQRLDTVRSVISAAVEAVASDRRAAAGIPEGDAESFVEVQAQALTTPWMAFFFEYDPRHDLARVDVPVLALGGARDLQVPTGQNLPRIEQAVRSGGNDRITVEELPGLNHLFQHTDSGSPREYGALTETFAPHVLEIVSGWILEVTGG